ncbi:decarboxylase [Mycobacteroides abscessus]|uniref:decarboxylase n=1 Tax=Mycobacteroides abscessus TaxID=36809 RepID=UPI0018787C89
MDIEPSHASGSTVSRRDFFKRTIVGGVGAASAMALSQALSACDSMPSSTATVSVDSGTFIDKSGDTITIGGKSTRWWTERYGSPLHITYAPAISANIEAFKSVFDRYYPRGEVRYATKAESHPAVMRKVLQTGAGADVASPFELRSALDSGFHPESLHINGNAKTDDLIDAAIEKDILIVADSVDELDVIASRTQRKRPRVLLRLSGFNLGNVTSTSLSTAGAWTKFGIAVDQVPDVLNRLSSYPVEVLGFHTHIGSQTIAVAAYATVLGKMLEFGRKLKQLGHSFEIINIGGGFPCSYGTEVEWNTVLERIREGHRAAMNGDLSKVFMWENKLGGFSVDAAGQPREWVGEVFYAPFPKEQIVERLLAGNVTVDGQNLGTVEALRAAGEPRLIIEPGRAVIGEAGVTLAKIEFLKTLSNGHNLVSTDLNSQLFREGRARLLSSLWNFTEDIRRKDATNFQAFVAGNLCFWDDILSDAKIEFSRRPRRGEIMMISATGAYSANVAASTANSFPRPNRLLIEDSGEVVEIKRADSYEQIYSL